MGEVWKTGATSGDLPSMEAQISAYKLTQYLMEVHLALKQCKIKNKTFCSESKVKCHVKFIDIYMENCNVLQLHVKNTHEKRNLPFAPEHRRAEKMVNLNLKYTALYHFQHPKV
jgi:hypothetical protein